MRSGEARGIVTAPIHKEALAAAGVGYPGHTEMLQALATEPGQAPQPVRMMLANYELRTVLVTIHMSLRRAIAQYMAHYHAERNHQGLENHLIRPESWHAANDGLVHRRARLGGMLN